VLDSSSPDSRVETELALYWLKLTSSPVLPPATLHQLSPTALAYLGDTVYELYIRMIYLFPPKRSQAYHQQVVAQVRAEAQAHHLQQLLPHLIAAELEIVRRGRNSASGGPRRLDPELYQHASSLETLIGYLYLSDPQRLVQLLSLLGLPSRSASALPESPAPE
jgi:ribonuclease III family protein